MSAGRRASCWSSLLDTCTRLVLLGVACAMSDAERAVEIPRRIATQRIRAQAGGALTRPALSHDGRVVAFDARHDPAACCQQVYVLDRTTGLTTLESVDSDGAPADGDSGGASLTQDGRIVAFETIASNLPSGYGRLASRHVVVRDRDSGSLLTPLMPGRALPDGESGQPALSGNGLDVVFTSDATNLAPEPDTNGRQTDVYLWRIPDASIRRVSVDSRGLQATTGASHSPSVSEDGAVVAFVSTARLAPEDTNDHSDIYLRDLGRGQTWLVSRGMGRTPSDGPSSSPSLSADGRSLAFASRAGNLAPHDGNQDSDVYLHDVATGSTRLVSATSNGSAANAGSRRPAMSADGRYVVYETVASNLGSRPGCLRRVPDVNLLPDVYLFDRTTACVTRISGSPDGEWWTPSVAPAIDAAGTVVVFSSAQPANRDDLTTDFDLYLFSGSWQDARYPPGGMLAGITAMMRPRPTTGSRTCCLPSRVPAEVLQLVCWSRGV